MQMTYPRRRSRRGTATVEAVIALPFFALILAALVFVGKTGRNQQDLADRVRTCAWLYAQQGCRERDKLPAECQGVLGQERVTQSVKDAFVEVGEATGPIETIQNAPVVKDVLGPIIEGLLGKTIRVSARAEQLRPALLGGGSLPLQSEQELLCASVPSHKNVTGELLGLLF